MTGVANSRETDLAKGLIARFGGRVLDGWEREDLERIEYVQLSGVKELDVRVLHSWLEQRYKAKEFKVTFNKLNWGLGVEDNKGRRSIVAYTYFPCDTCLTVSRDASLV